MWTHHISKQPFRTHAISRRPRDRLWGGIPVCHQQCASILSARVCGWFAIGGNICDSAGDILRALNFRRLLTGENMSKPCCSFCRRLQIINTLLNLLQRFFYLLINGIQLVNEESVHRKRDFHFHLEFFRWQLCTMIITLHELNCIWQYFFKLKPSCLTLIQFHSCLERFFNFSPLIFSVD